MGKSVPQMRFPDIVKKFPVRLEKFPVPLLREFAKFVAKYQLVTGARKAQ